MATVFVLLDAFRSDYISLENTPFLYECANKGIHFKKIKPSLGFCERAEIFSGLTPIESGYFTALANDPSRSPFNKMKFPIEKLELIEFSQKY